jgi:thiamine biosynthesis protein ThiS
MKLILNGEPFDWPGQGVLTDLLQSLGTNPEQVAVLVNDEVVVKMARLSCRLQDGDRVELLAFAGGG